MATNNIVLVATTSCDMGTLSFADWGKGRVTRELERGINSLATGSNTGTIDVQLNPVYASQTITFATSSGAVGATIGGTLKTVTWATSDTASAAAFAAAVNADATLGTWVTATSVAGVITLTANLPGTMGNAITTVASGTGVSAGGARLAGGTGTAGLNSFTC